MRGIVAVLVFLNSTPAIADDPAGDARKMKASLECAVLAQASGDKMQDEAVRLGKVGMSLALSFGERVKGAYLTGSWGALGQLASSAEPAFWQGVMMEDANIAITKLLNDRAPPSKSGGDIIEEQRQVAFAEYQDRNCDLIGK